MKKSIHPATRKELLRRYDQEGPADGWFFRIREISANHFIVEGQDSFGRHVGRSGSDPEELLAACVTDAEELNRSLKS